MSTLNDDDISIPEFIRYWIRIRVVCSTLHMIFYRRAVRAAGAQCMIIFIETTKRTCDDDTCMNVGTYIWLRGRDDDDGLSESRVKKELNTNYRFLRFNEIPKSFSLINKSTNYNKPWQAIWRQSTTWYSLNAHTLQRARTVNREISRDN